jgi:hypothetical protein
MPSCRFISGRSNIVWPYVKGWIPNGMGQAPLALDQHRQAARLKQFT